MYVCVSLEGEAGMVCGLEYRAPSSDVYGYTPPAGTSRLSTMCGPKEDLLYVR